MHKTNLYKLKTRGILGALFALALNVFVLTVIYSLSLSLIILHWCVWYERIPPEAGKRAASTPPGVLTQQKREISSSEIAACGEKLKRDGGE